MDCAEVDRPGSRHEPIGSKPRLFKSNDLDTEKHKAVVLSTPFLLEFTTGAGGRGAYLDGNRMGLRTWGLTAVLDDSSGRSRGLLARFVGLGHGDSSSQGPTP